MIWSIHVNLVLIFGLPSKIQVCYQVVIGSIHVNLVLIVWATIKDSGVLPSSYWVNTCEFGTDLWATIKDSGVLPSSDWVNTCEFGTDRFGNHQRFRCATK